MAVGVHRRQRAPPSTSFLGLRFDQSVRPLRDRRGADQVDLCTPFTPRPASSCASVCSRQPQTEGQLSTFDSGIVTLGIHQNGWFVVELFIMVNGVDFPVCAGVCHN